MEPVQPADKPTPQPPGRFGRRLPILCALYAMAAVGGWFVLRYLSDRWWPATVLLYFPRWPWLLPLLILLPRAARRGRKLWVAPLLTGLFILGPGMGFNIPVPRFSAPAGTGQKIRLLSFNVHRLELSVPALDSCIITSDPDVVVLQDYSGWDASPVLNGPGWNTYRLGEIFIASRFPIARVHDLHLETITGADDVAIPRRTGVAACFELDTPRGPLRVLNLHLASPHPALEMLATDPLDVPWLLGANSIRRWKESELITQWLAEHPGPPVVLAGDFNTLAESHIYRRFWSGYPDAFPETGWGYGYTHLSPLSELRIDHILTTPGVHCTDMQIGPACGSPHRPLVADLILQANGR